MRSAVTPTHNAAQAHFFGQNSERKVHYCVGKSLDAFYPWKGKLLFSLGVVPYVRSRYTWVMVAMLMTVSCKKRTSISNAKEKQMLHDLTTENLHQSSQVGNFLTVWWVHKILIAQGCFPPTQTQKSRIRWFLFTNSFTLEMCSWNHISLQI